MCSAQALASLSFPVSAQSRTQYKPAGEVLLLWTGAVLRRAALCCVLCAVCYASVTRCDADGSKEDRLVSLGQEQAVSTLGEAP